jgi:Tfp pilus assembly protein PilX
MRTSRPPRDRQSGAALAVTLIAITALLGLGALTVMSVQSDLSSAGASRFSQSALYAAESGASAGMDFLRTNGSVTTLFTAWVSPANATPPMPTAIVGNNVMPGQVGNPFNAAGQAWYRVTILNNIEDAGFLTGIDNDGTVTLHSEGHGPDGTTAIVEMTVQNTSILATFCEREYAQRNVTSRNDANAACSARVTSGALRTFTP